MKYPIPSDHNSSILVEDNVKEQFICFFEVVVVENLDVFFKRLKG